jgi:hypothetical protein
MLSPVPVLNVKLFVHYQRIINTSDNFLTVI